MLTLSSVPLQGVLVGDLTKVVLDNGGQSVVVEMVGVDLSAEVELALGLELVVQVVRAVAATAVGRGSAASSGGWAATRAGNTLRVVVTGKLSALTFKNAATVFCKKDISYHLLALLANRARGAGRRAGPVLAATYHEKKELVCVRGRIVQ